MTDHTSTSLNPKTLAYLNNIFPLLVVTSVVILMHSFPGVCCSILVFHQTNNIVFHLIFVYFVEVSEV